MVEVGLEGAVVDMEVVEDGEADGVRDAAVGASEKVGGEIVGATVLLVGLRVPSMHPFTSLLLCKR